jgi:CHAT domain-containing protein
MKRIRASALGVSIFLVAVACRPEAESKPVNVTRSASATLSLPTDPRALAALLAVAPDSLHAAAQERYGRGAFDSARVIFGVAANRAHTESDSRREARSLMWLGLSEWRLGDYTEARRHGEASLNLKRQTGLDDEISRSFNALGLLAWNEGRHHDALRNLDSAVVTARRHQDKAGVARASANIPLVMVELGDYDAARKGFLAAFDAGHAVKDDIIQGNALANLAMLEIRLGDPSKAVPLLARARTFYASGEYTAGESNALGQLATAFSEMGDLQSAIAVADSGLAIARAHGLRQEVAATLEVIADLHDQAGSARLALRRLHEADSLDALLGLAVERGNNLRRTSAILLEMGESGSAVVRAKGALVAHRAADDRGEIVNDRLQLAEALAVSGNNIEAAIQADSAFLDASRSGNALLIRDATVVTSSLALSRGKPRDAFTRLTAINDKKLDNDWILADLRAATLVSLDRLDDAKVQGERSVAALERERASLGFGPLRSSYLSNRTGPFSRLVMIHLARHDTAAAFSVAAAPPGRTLAERLGGVAVASAPIAPLAQSERVLLRVAAIERQLAESPSGETHAALEHALEDARAEHEDLVAHLARAPRDRLLGLASIGLHEVQQALSPASALITFLSGPEHLDVFVVRSNSVFHRSVPITDKALSARIRIARGLVANASRTHGIPPPLADLYDLLLAPATAVGALGGVSHLLIVPQGSLGAVPFSALWNRRTGRFLVEDFVLTYLPTVAALKDDVHRPAVSLDKLVVFAPLSGELKGTAKETRAIARIFPTASVRLGNRSSEESVKEALRLGLPVHLATHGSHNSQNPLFSRLTVGRAERPSSGDDGILNVYEILGLRTSSSLVFLSGCETGLGAEGQDPFAANTDLGSLAQAFLIAGASTVVATLWTVDDNAAADIAERFYRHMRLAASPDEALALAQRETIASRNGLGWAAYTVSGRTVRKSHASVRGTVKEH